MNGHDGICKIRQRVLRRQQPGFPTRLRPGYVCCCGELILLCFLWRGTLVCCWVEVGIDRIWSSAGCECFILLRIRDDFTWCIGWKRLHKCVEPAAVVNRRPRPLQVETASAFAYPPGFLSTTQVDSTASFHARELASMQSDSVRVHSSFSQGQSTAD